MTGYPNPISNKAQNAGSGPDENKAVKARLLLRLIKDGTIPKPPDSFFQELQQLAGQLAADDSKDLKDRVKGLAAHLQSIGATLALQKSERPAAIQKNVEPVHIATNAAAQQQNPTADFPMASLQDQHPAVIKSQLAKLDGAERASQLRALPGETARQVSLLNWQPSKK
ncbi:MAG: hypothetical protein AAGA08_00965 [Pseudomonadota bacterium]